MLDIQIVMPHTCNEAVLYVEDLEARRSRQFAGQTPVLEDPPVVQFVVTHAKAACPDATFVVYDER